MTTVDVLIPTRHRKTALAMVLTSLAGQTHRDFTVTVSDQSDPGRGYLDDREIQMALDHLRWRGHPIRVLRHWPRRGLAEHRHFLLQQSSAPYVHFIDDDVLLDPPVMDRMLAVLTEESCGFVGCAATGLHHLDDVRPQEQAALELWDGPVRAEPFSTRWVPWDRHRVNNAANPLHLEQKLCRDGQTVRYKVAWVGGANILFDRAKLLSVGGFEWWDRLPPEHAGEEVVAQFMVIRKYGGCGILPSGTYHLDLPTKVPDRSTNAVSLFGDLIETYDPEPEHRHWTEVADSRELVAVNT